MKINKKALINQREIIEEKLKPWSLLSSEKTPPVGWIKAIRGSLGMTARQLGARLGLDHSGILRLEAREASGAVTLEMLKRTAEAMNCKLIYAIVPKDGVSSLEAILDEQALKSARVLTRAVEHSMRLEKQGVEGGSTEKQIITLAAELKKNLDPLLWDATQENQRKRNFKK